MNKLFLCGTQYHVLEAVAACLKESCRAEIGLSDSIPGRLALADRLRQQLEALGVPFLVPGVTNQLFPILPDDVLAELSKKYVFCEQERVDDSHRAVRFCTSWATREEAVEALCADLRKLLG